MKSSRAFVPFGVVALLASACAAPATADSEASSLDSALNSNPAETGATAKVRAREIGEANGGSCWATRQDFDVRYENHTLPWGTKVELRYGVEQYVNCSDCSTTVSYIPWENPETVAIPPSGAWIWEKTVAVDDEGGRAGGGVDALDFVFKITLPNGDVVWDNGGTSHRGYYRASKVPAGSGLCGPAPAPFANATVSRLSKP